MKNRFLYIIIILISFAPSCNSWLDTKPKTQVDIKDMFKDADGFKDALIACYIKMNAPEVYGQKMIITELEYLAQHWDLNKDNYRDEIRLKNFDYTTDYAKKEFKSIYGALYNIVSQANIILENCKINGQNIDDEKLRAMIEGEALAIRAFCLTDILRIFGQVPKNSTINISLPYPEGVSTVNPPYYTYNEFVRKLFTDIERAASLLKEGDPIFDYSFAELDEFSKYNIDKFLGYRRFRFNYYAVKAMEARLYLYTGKTTEAYTTAMEIINSSDKKGEKQLILAGSSDINNQYYALPSECIVALSNFEIDKHITILNNRTGLSVTKKTLDNDIFSGQSTSTNNRYGVWNTSAATSTGIIVPVIRKYEQPTEDKKPSSAILATKKQVVPLIRLSEIYLIAMETAPALSDANTLYIEYMRARGIAADPLSDTSNLMTELVKEYRREFFAEGQMFFNYKRRAETKMLWKNDRDVTEKDYIVPLPTTEFNSNN